MFGRDTVEYPSLGVALRIHTRISQQGGPYSVISDANLKCALWVSLLPGIDPEEGGRIVEILLIS